MSLTCKLYDLDTNELADISAIALERQMTRALSLPRTFTIQAPANHPLLTTAADDGYPNLRRGNRKLIVWEDAAPTQPIFHGRVQIVERNGDGQTNRVSITARTPVSELGYEGNDQAGRVVRGSTVQPTAGDPFGEYDGNFINPLFASSVADQDEISGPDMILQVLTNSQNTGDEGDPSPGEGPLPIDLTLGTFDLDVPDAVDLRSVTTMDWPVLIGDFIQQLIATGVVDVDERPLDPSEGFSLEMVALSAVSAFGSDKNGSVHFDYFTGSKNASACNILDDFTKINNKLYAYLGPRVSPNAWLGNITPSGAPTDLATAIAASRTLYGGEFMSITVFDTTGSESDARPLFVALWDAEQGFRVEPRALLHFTPAQGQAALYDAPSDFDVGDLVGVNVDGLGVSIATTQRVYGFTKTWNREGVAQFSELLTSADEAS